MAAAQAGRSVSQDGRRLGDQSAGYLLELTSAPCDASGLYPLGAFGRVPAFEAISDMLMVDVLGDVLGDGAHSGARMVSAGTR